MTDELTAKHITFEKASLQHKNIIFEWLDKSHMKEFWDNSQEHKDDIINFINGRKQHYFYGTIQYWIGLMDREPYCFILSDQILPKQEDLTKLHIKNLSKTGHTITIDFGIGNTKHLGRGFASPTLENFINYYSQQVDLKADTFFIDPDDNNPKAMHVYEKAGFKLMGSFKCKKAYWDFKGNKSYLMVKRIK